MPNLKSRAYWLLFFTAVILVPIFSFGQNPPAAENIPTQTAPAQTIPADQALPTHDVQGFLEPFVYDPRGRRDPFKPYGSMLEELLPKKQADGSPMQTVIDTKPLQSYDLDQFKLVAVMWDINTPKAMFQDPRAQVHVVGRDERIGRKNGYIAMIREGEVVVVEQLKNDEDQISYATKVLRIQR